MVFRKDVREAIVSFLRDNGEKSTGQIARAIGMSIWRTRHYLRMLVCEGKLKVRKLSDRVLLWSLREEQKIE